jgi:hypothetical protein
VFASAIHFHPSLIFAGKAGAYQSGAPYKNAPANKYKIRVEVNGSGKHTITISINFIVHTLGYIHTLLSSLARALGPMLWNFLSVIYEFS